MISRLKKHENVYCVSLIQHLMIMLLFLPVEQLKLFILLVKSSHGQRKVNSTIYLRFFVFNCFIMVRIIILLLVFVSMPKKTVKVLRVLMKKLWLSHSLI